ncbi:MAG: hypothetical protein N3G20_05080 [Verrucomicrobiae bacterium]|nr:hypothetical protein [Verrucomicrobiae bacterium]
MLEAHETNAGRWVSQMADPSGVLCELAPVRMGSVWRPLTRFPIPQVVDASSLRRFVEEYRDQVMVALELPAARDAYWHATRYEVRELISLDASLGRSPALRRFAEASRAVGRHQLRRLLPLRDQKLVRRYWHAVESGQAHGWHAVVFGVVLSLFSLPLRQGLIYYGYQTLQGFLRAGANGLALPEPQTEGLLEEICLSLPGVVDRTISPNGTLFRVVR